MGFFPRHDASTIIDGCNDLLLYYASRPAAFHVVNPSTRRRAALPAPRALALLSVLRSTPAPPRATRTDVLPQLASVRSLPHDDLRSVLQTTLSALPSNTRLCQDVRDQGGRDVAKVALVGKAPPRSTRQQRCDL
ncbi:F-box protein [Panicum miliaceum]|uniref:F-box protein n=1 Tax=Panicum miliaceum TaxID=4540 RepID=A0A3L6SI45_PANMI|nr:F-box protein [Panicum miliaceum]